ncbi:MAG: DNA-directed RNA polymerase subunit omega [Cyclobacteriaceae bacterium]
MSQHNPSIITRDLNELTEPTGNLYKSIRIIAQRAKQLSVTGKEELNQKLAEFASTVDNLEEIFENREQIEISRYYERMPKSTVNAIHEFLDDKLFHRKRDEEK